MEKIVLYVKELNADESIGITDDPDTIAYNNSIISSAFVNQLTDVLLEQDAVSGIGYLGRYIISVDISLEQHQYRMAFMDLKQVEEKARFLKSKNRKQ